MEDKDQNNPEGRAFSGHSDHPPGEPDQAPEANQDLLREGGNSGEKRERQMQEGESPGDQGTNLPGYG